MARLIYPADFPGQKALNDNIYNKDAADGAGSVLTAYLTQHHISMTDLVQAGIKATQFDASSKLLHKQSENYSQQRDLLFNPIFDAARGATQFLKSFYRGQAQELGAWGITVDGRGRITWPADFAARQALVLVFLDKHASFPNGESPLQPYLAQHSIDPAAWSANAVTALAKHNTFVQAQKDAEEATQNRNNTWGPAWAQVQGMGNFLMKLFVGSQKKLGEWGFNVDDSPKAAKLRTTTLKLGEMITINSVTLGGTFSNIGETDLHVYRGKTTTGTPTIVERKTGQMGILKGWSVITVVNPDTLREGKFTVLASK